MNDNKWDNLIFLVEEKFGIDKKYKEKVEIAMGHDGNPVMGEKECLEFNGFGGKMKIERLEKPKIIDKKVLSTKRIGGKVAVDYVYSRDEMSYQVSLYKMNEAGEWQPVDLTSLAQ